MKKISLFLLIVCIGKNSFAQTQTVTGNSFITTLDNIVVYGVKADGNIDTSEHFKVSKGTKFNANGFDKTNNVKITFWKYQDSDKDKKMSDLDSGYTTDYTKGKEFIREWANYKDFIMELPVFNAACKIYYGKKDEFTWGVMTLPIKARLGDKKDRLFDVEENLNLGFTFGLRHQIQSKHEEAINFLAGVSIGRVKADSISLKNNFPTPESSIAASLMFSGGFLYQYENFQVGLFLGVDNVMGELGRNWKFQGKPWIGFAIGVSLFSTNASESGTGNNTGK